MEENAAKEKEGEKRKRSKKKDRGKRKQLLLFQARRKPDRNIYWGSPDKNLMAETGAVISVEK